MTNYAVLDVNGLIVNRAVGNGAWTPPAGFTAVAETGQVFEIGGSYVGGVYTPPSQPAPPALSPEGTRRKTFLDDVSRANILAKLQSSSSSQIDSYVTANVTNLAQAQTMIGIILKLIALDTRQ